MYSNCQYSGTDVAYHELIQPAAGERLLSENARQERWDWRPIRSSLVMRRFVIAREFDPVSCPRDEFARTVVLRVVSERLEEPTLGFEPRTSFLPRMCSAY